MSILVLTALITAGLYAIQGGEVTHILKVVAVAVCFSVAVILFRSVRRSERLPDVELYDDVMVLPIGKHSEESRTVLYESLRGAVTRGRAPHDEIVLDAGGHTYVYPRELFEDEEAPDIFFMQLRNRLGRHPRGTQIVAEIRHREVLARRLFRIRPYVTYGLLAVVVVGYGLQYLLGGLTDQLVSARLGANVTDRTLSGEWYRAFTSNFLHGSPLHIYLNGLSLLSLGSAVERLTGRWTYLFVFLVSAVGGALTSALVNPGVISLGVSTAVFGLLGALAVLHLFYRRDVPMGYRQSRQWWVFIIGVSAILPILVPVIDFGAHLGGFAAGAVATYLAMRIRGGPRGTSDKVLRPLTALVVLVYVVAFTQAGLAAVSFDARDRAEIAEQLFDRRISRYAQLMSQQPSELNALQFAQVLSSSATMRGPAWLDGEPRELEVSVRNGDSLELTGAFSSEEGARIWLLAHREGELKALIRGEIGAAVSPPVALKLDESLEGYEMSVVAVELGGCGCGRSVANATVWMLPIAAPTELGSKPL
ncbi:MAG: rhomboid family intramembrane serine protease [Myxococcota bacterium]